jgi:hypothetical protein
MKNMFLGITIIGAIVPYAFFIPFFVDNGLIVTTFLSALFANGAASGFTADLLISSFAFWLFLFSRGESKLWIYVLINLSIGLSCALPLYFYHQSIVGEGNSQSG